MERLTVWQAEVSASRVGEGKVDCRDLPGEVQQRIMHGTRKSRISSNRSWPACRFRPVPGSRSNTGRAASSFGSRSAVSFAGACLRCGRLVFNSVRIRRVLIPPHFRSIVQGIEFRFSVGPNTILAKFACSFTHFATAASASRNQDGEVLLSSSQPCLSASESSCSNLALRASSLSISASLPATCSRYAWSMASEMESASSWTADKTE